MTHLLKSIVEPPDSLTGSSVDNNSEKHSKAYIHVMTKIEVNMSKSINVVCQK